MGGKRITVLAEAEAGRALVSIILGGIIEDNA